MNYDTFVEAVTERARFKKQTAAHELITSTLTLLGGRLRGVDRRAIAAQLPSELARALVSDNMDHPAPMAADLDTFINELNARTAQPVDIDQLRGVCQVLAEALDEQARSHLRIQPLNPLFSATIH